MGERPFGYVGASRQTALVLVNLDPLRAEGPGGGLKVHQAAVDAFCPTAYTFVSNPSIVAKTALPATLGANPMDGLVGRTIILPSRPMLLAESETHRSGNRNHSAGQSVAGSTIDTTEISTREPQNPRRRGSAGNTTRQRHRIC